MTKHPTRTVVLCSGGLDSTTCLALAKDRGDEVFALSFDYGQRHRVELDAAQRIVKHFNIRQHCITSITLPNPKTNALTDCNLEVPAHQPNTEAIPITYVPGRNTLFLAYALSFAESIQAQRIMIGCSHVDYSGYPDCRPDYIQAFEQVARLAVPEGIQGQPIHIEAPLMHLSKSDTIALGHSLGVDYSMTISCYRATSQNPACGTCDSCQLRLKGFEDFHTAQSN